MTLTISGGGAAATVALAGGGAFLVGERTAAMVKDEFWLGTGTVACVVFSGTLPTNSNPWSLLQVT